MRKPEPRRFNYGSKEHRQMRELMANLWAQCPPDREASFFDDFRHKHNLDPVYVAQLVSEVKYGVAV